MMKINQILCKLTYTKQVLMQTMVFIEFASFPFILVFNI